MSRMADEFTVPLHLTPAQLRAVLGCLEDESEDYENRAGSFSLFAAPIWLPPNLAEVLIKIYDMQGWPPAISDETIAECRESVANRSNRFCTAFGYDPALDQDDRYFNAYVLYLRGDCDEPDPAAFAELDETARTRIQNGAHKLMEHTNEGGVA